MKRCLTRNLLNLAQSTSRDHGQQHNSGSVHRRPMSSYRLVDMTERVCVAKTYNKKYMRQYSYLVSINMLFGKIIIFFLWRMLECSKMKNDQNLCSPSVREVSGWIMGNRCPPLGNVLLSHRFRKCPPFVIPVNSLSGSIRTECRRLENQYMRQWIGLDCRVEYRAPEIHKQSLALSVYGETRNRRKKSVPWGGVSMCWTETISQTKKVAFGFFRATFECHASTTLSNIWIIPRQSCQLRSSGEISNALSSVPSSHPGSGRLFACWLFSQPPHCPCTWLSWWKFAPVRHLDSGRPGSPRSYSSWPAICNTEFEYNAPCYRCVWYHFNALSTQHHHSHIVRSKTLHGHFESVNDPNHYFNKLEIGIHNIRRCSQQAQSDPRRWNYLLYKRTCVGMCWK